MTLLSGIGLIIGFAFLCFSVYKKWNLIISAAITAAIIALFGGVSVTDALTKTFVSSLGGFGAGQFFVFILGAVFAKILEESGAAWRLGTVLGKKLGEKYTLLAYVLVTALLAYGGVSVFVVVFILLPLARNMFKDGRIPWALFPAMTTSAAVLGGSMPGAIQQANIIPSTYLGTKLSAGLLPGVVGMIVYFIVFMLYFRFVIKKNHDESEYEITGEAALVNVNYDEMDKKAPSFIIALIPIVFVLVIINIFNVPVYLGLAAASVLALILFHKSFNGVENMVKAVGAGANNGALPLIMVCMVVGIGSVVSLTPAYATIRDWLMGLAISPLAKLIIVVNVMAFVTGSSTGSMSMVASLFSADFLALGVSAEAIHRLLSMASAGFDSMPWNSLIVMLMTLSGVSYKKGYKHCFVSTVICPLIGAIVAAIVFSLMS